MREIEKATENNPHKSPLVDVDKIAEVLHVPTSWVYGRTRKGTIPMHRVGKYVRFDLDEIMAWLKAGCPETWKK